MIQVCQAIYGNERGAALQSFLEKATGEPCPCAQGRVCPLMPPAPRDSAEVVAPVA